MTSEIMLGGVTSFLSLKEVTNTSKRMRHSPTIGGNSLKSWKNSNTSNVFSSLYLDLYVLGDDALISKGSFMQTKQLFVLIHI